MWWYALQVVVGGAVLLSNVAYGWGHGTGPLVVPAIALAAAAFVTALVDEPLGFFRWIRAKFSRSSAEDSRQRP